MADKRYFVKLDVGYWDNPKIVELDDSNPRAVVMHQRAICYSRQHLTDGVFLIRQLAAMSRASFCGSTNESCNESLNGSLCDFCAGVARGVFHRVDERRAVTHDYAEHQETAHDVARRSAAGRKAAEAKKTKRETSNRATDRSTNRSTNRATNRTTEERRGEETTSLRDVGAAKPQPDAEASAKPTRAARRTRIPNDWTPTPTLQAYAWERGVDPNAEAEKFRNHHEAKGSLMASWDAAWRTWIGNAQKWAANARSADGRSRDQIERDRRRALWQARSMTETQQGA